MKDYEKALATYEKGLTYDPDNQELKEGKMRCHMQIARFLNGTASEEELKERQARALADPEVQNIMTDPTMQQVLKECQEDPKSINKHMQNAMIAGKLRKLMTAGIIRLA
jgi:stress-induced-phosphoprotein 1